MLCHLVDTTCDFLSIQIATSDQQKLVFFMDTTGDFLSAQLVQFIDPT